MSISPQWDREKRFIRELKVTCLDKDKQQLKEMLATNIILGVGKQPFIPAGAFCTSPRIIHTHNLMPQLSQQFPDFQKSYKFIIVGSGQSAGEIALYILNNYPNANIHWCFRSFALKGIDNSPFVNQQYHQTAIDNFYQLDEIARSQALVDLKQSNYAVIDSEVLTNLTQIHYEELLQGKLRLIIHSGLHMKEILLHAQHIEVIFDDLYHHTVETIDADGAILATGYTSNPALSLLKHMEEFLVKKQDGSYKILRDYRLTTQPQLTAGIYLQGYCETTHGPSDATLAILATRAEQILHSIFDNNLVTESKLKEYACN